MNEIQRHLQLHRLNQIVAEFLFALDLLIEERVSPSDSAKLSNILTRQDLETAVSLLTQLGLEHDATCLQYEIEGFIFAHHFHTWVNSELVEKGIPFRTNQYELDGAIRHIRQLQSVVSHLDSNNSSNSNMEVEESDRERHAKCLRPDNYTDRDLFERDNWIREKRMAGWTIRKIRETLNKNHKEWSPLYSDGGVYHRIKHFSQHHNLPVPTGKPGRPKKTANPQ